MLLKKLFQGMSFLISCAVATTVSAIPITFTDRLAFETAITGEQTIDFEGVDSFLFHGSSFTDSGVTFSDDIGKMFSVDQNFYTPALASDYLHLNASGVHFIEITAGAGATAIGADFGSLNQFFGTSLAIDVAVTDGSGTSLFNLTALTQPALDFIGFTSDSLITSVRFSGEVLVLDNVTTGNYVAAIPEPATLALVAFGLAGIGCARRNSFKCT